jgi:hypothetical protein
MDGEKRTLKYNSEDTYESLSSQLLENELLFASGNYRGIEANIRISDERDYSIITNEDAVSKLSFFAILKNNIE